MLNVVCGDWGKNCRQTTTTTTAQWQKQHATTEAHIRVSTLLGGAPERSKSVGNGLRQGQAIAALQEGFLRLAQLSKKLQVKQALKV